MALYSRWLELPLHVRVTIATQHKLERKGNVEVFNNQVIKDGYDLKDIEQVLSSMSNEAFEALVSGILGKPVQSPFGVSTLTQKEVLQMNQEYEDRNPGKTAPVPETSPEMNEPMDIDDISKTVEDNANTPTLDETIEKNKKTVTVKVSKR